MLYAPKSIILPGGQTALLRRPCTDDVPQLLSHMRTVAAETDFLLRYPEECNITPQQECEYIETLNQSNTDIMLNCFIDGLLAGNCSLMCSNRKKTRHYATIGISIASAYWHMGIGTALMTEIINVGRSLSLHHLELCYIEGNERARALYERLGFVQVATIPNAFLMPDGRLCSDNVMHLAL